MPTTMISAFRRRASAAFSFLMPFCLTLLILTPPTSSASNSTQPLPCAAEDGGGGGGGGGRRICAAYLYYKLSSNESRADVAALLAVDLAEVEADPRSEGKQAVFVRVNCKCEDGVYLYTPARAAAAAAAYEGLAWANGTKNVSLLCGCLDRTLDFAALLSYYYSLSSLPQTLPSLASRFSSSIASIVSLNNITDENLLLPNRLYFLPVNIAQLTQPPPPPPPRGVAPLVATADDTQRRGGGDEDIPMGSVIGIVAATCVVVLAGVGLMIVARKMVGRKRASGGGGGGGGGGGDDYKGSKKRGAEMMISAASLAGGADTPILYSHDEILIATDNLNESNSLGHGAFGTVYYGFLRDQEVAIKRLKASITKEFLAEIKILCKFHHTNLNQLYGYAAFGEDDLFLVYEYAHHRSLSDRLHQPISKGFPPLTWISRVQIALDTAKGLEYIHEHTKEHYVHRDVKSSNILLDSDFRAKVADFGIAKLVEKTGGGDVSVTRIVGTFGYLAPEYSRDGIATSKSDVYAFGVVLFELITGKHAISKSRSSIPSTPERRSLVSIVLRALKDCPNPIQISGLREIIDAGLNDLFPPDCVHKMAKLGQQCVEEDPILRPDMKYVVFTLSQILLSSIEWEATVAGSSQIFSGLVQGR